MDYLKTFSWMSYIFAHIESESTLPILNYLYGKWSWNIYLYIPLMQRALGYSIWSKWQTWLLSIVINEMLPSKAKSRYAKYQLLLKLRVPLLYCSPPQIYRLLSGPIFYDTNMQVIFWFSCCLLCCNIVLHLWPRSLRSFNIYEIVAC